MNGEVTGNIFELSSLKGGLDDTSPYITMSPDVCVQAENVEFIKSTLGERRKGCVAVANLPGSITGATMDCVSWMYRHLPTNDQTAAELWVLAQSLSIDLSVIAKRDSTTWTVISPDDPFQVGGSQGHRLSAQTLHGKLFIAGKTAVNRLHVWDGTNLRRTGLAAPNAPTAANSAVGGTIAGTRYYRVRYVVMSGSTVVLRGEPSAVLTFIPDGAHNGIIVTKPASTSEHETHWELEASTDNANFYRVARTVVGTTTYTDTVVYGTGYASTGVLSDAIGLYTLIPSGKFLSVDEDRLLIAGSWENPAEASRLRWTPKFLDPLGTNDERLDATISPYLDLDGYEGGEITGLSRNVDGYNYVFKRSHIYKVMRTGTSTSAYEAVPITKDRGALPGSLVEAIDQSGSPSLYFLDAAVGPMRIGPNGMQWCGRDIQTLWKRVNVNANVPCHGVYYGYNRQVHYWLAVDGADTPNLKIVLHVNEVRDTEEGARRGWVTVSKNARIATAECSVMFSSNVDSSDPRNYTLVPLIGKQKWVVGASTITNIIQRCDTGGTDAYTTGDTAATYYGTVISRPFTLAGLLAQFEVLTGSLLLKSEETPDGCVFVKLVKNFGEDSKTATVTFATETDSTHIIASMNDLQMAELYSLQLSMGDLDAGLTPPSTWELDMVQLKITGGNSA